jgi:parvulin-like peptidyl-prolyl isomerase
MDISTSTLTLNSDLRNFFDVTAADMVHCLKKQFQYQSTCQSISANRLIKQVALDRGLQVSDLDIQMEADRFRHANGLEHAADTLNWLKAQQITPELWEESIRDRLLSDRLAHHLFDQDVERTFAENRVIYEQVALYQLVVPYEKLAMELFYQIDQSEISFYRAAHLYDIDPVRRRHCGFEGLLVRGQIEPRLSSIVFGSEPQQVTQPIQLDNSYHLIWVEEFLAAALTDQIRQELLDQLFQTWVTNELNHARHL